MKVLFLSSLLSLSTNTINAAITAPTTAPIIEYDLTLPVKPGILTLSPSHFSYPSYLYTPIPYPAIADIKINTINIITAEIVCIYSLLECDF